MIARGRDVAVLALGFTWATLAGCAASGTAKTVADKPAKAGCIKITPLKPEAQAKLPKGVPTYEARYVAKGKIKVDGKLGDWKKAAWIELKDRKYVGGGPGWDGPEDLSARFAVAFDTQGLYFAAEVTDDKFFSKHAGEALWRNDSIQIAVDPMLDRSAGVYQPDDVELGFALVNGKPQAWRWVGETAGGPGSVQGATIVIRRDEDAHKTIYEVYIPQKAMRPLDLGVMTRCGFDMIVNDNDGDGRAFYVEWTPGIGATKDPSSFGVVTFRGAPESAEPALVAGLQRRTVVVEVGEPLEFLLWTTCRKGVDTVLEAELTYETKEQTKKSESFTAPVCIEPGHRKYRIEIATNKLAVARYTAQLRLKRKGTNVTELSTTVYVVPRSEP